MVNSELGPLGIFGYLYNSHPDYPICFPYNFVHYYRLTSFGSVFDGIVCFPAPKAPLSVQYYHNSTFVFQQRTSHLLFHHTENFERYG